MLRRQADSLHVRSLGDNSFLATWDMSEPDRYPGKRCALPDTALSSCMADFWDKSELVATYWIPASRLRIRSLADALNLERQGHYMHQKNVVQFHELRKWR